MGYRAYKLWRKLPPAKRRALVEAARAQGPRVATVLAAAAKARRKV